MRKKTLYYSFLLAYVFVFICSFLIIDIWTSAQNMHILTKEKAKFLYDSINMINDKIISGNFENINENENIKYALDTEAAILNSNIHAIDTSGKILYSSDAIRDNQLREFDITDFGNNYYVINHFYDIYDDTYLTVALPVTYDFKTAGYLLIHYNTKELFNMHLDMQNTVYFTSLFIFLLTLIILIVFTVTVFIPLKQLSTAAREYAKGNFTYEGLSNFNSDNEIGKLGLSLEFMASELNNKEVDERNFIGNISHDFRSPLTSIKGYIEAMKDGTIPYEMQDKYLNIVLFETDRLRNLTENLLTFNRWDSNGPHLDYSTFNINTLIEQNLASLEGKCEKKSVRLVFRAPYYNLMVEADKDKISQVFYNLVDNAIKFSNNDSSITVSVSSKGEKVFVSVKDTGIGIPKDSINKIWDRFYKTDLSRGKDKTGSGLGLSIVKSIINAHNENINVISTVGVGTEFIFTLKKA